MSAILMRVILLELFRVYSALAHAVLTAWEAVELKPRRWTRRSTGFWTTTCGLTEGVYCE